ncbi:hypothetical protein LSM04_007306 [Trypanosoma melophagium]|uniref:uncharacterized protein n=1 Tax=Trypanosoma melophagium TaxID=715481 RepID=UPI00351A1688|nr:hypothetical protein LSM04_007306 [Trypanosoma melophagium]
MEEDLFSLIDRDFDGLVTLEETLQCFEHLGFIRGIEFRQMVCNLCAHFGVRLGNVWSVCVEQAFYVAFTKNATRPEMTVPLSTMEAIQRRLVESGEVCTDGPSVYTAGTPEYLDYANFIEFFLLRWPHLSRAKVASLLLQTKQHQ